MRRTKALAMAQEKGSGDGKVCVSDYMPQK